jgi:hypothetical protein
VGALVLLPSLGSAGTLEMDIRGAVDPDSGARTTAVDSAVDFGNVSPVFGSSEGELIAARDGSGTYLVATLEVEVRRVPSAWERHQLAERIPPDRGRLAATQPRIRNSAGRTAPEPGRAGAASTPYAASRRHHSRPRFRTEVSCVDRPIEVAIEIRGLTGDIEARYAPGTDTDWGAGAGVGIPLGPQKTVLFTAPPMGGHWLHQVALFSPEPLRGVVGVRSAYSASSGAGDGRDSTGTRNSR